MYAESQNVSVWVYMYVFTNSSARAGCDTRPIFKGSLPDFNSKFSFS